SRSSPLQDRQTGHRDIHSMAAASVGLGFALSTWTAPLVVTWRPDVPRAASPAHDARPQRQRPGHAVTARRPRRHRATSGMVLHGPVTVEIRRGDRAGLDVLRRDSRRRPPVSGSGSGWLTLSLTRRRRRAATGAA